MKKIVVSFLVVMSLFIGCKSAIDANHIMNNSLLNKQQIALSGDEKDPQILSIGIDRTL